MSDATNAPSIDTPPAGTTTHERPHLSHTQLDVFARCQERYRRQYLEREKPPRGVYAARGVALHRAAQTNWEQKIASFEDLPMADVLDAAAASYDDEIARGVELSRDQARMGRGVVIGRERDQAVALARTYRQKIAGDYQPTLVEEHVSIELSGTHDLWAVIDCATLDGEVVDLKTTTRRLTQADADHSMQLTIYAAAYEVVFGAAPKAVRLEVMQCWGESPSRRRLSSVRTLDDYRVLDARVSVMLATLEAGYFAPAPIGAWWCNESRCPFWSTCKFINARK